MIILCFIISLTSPTKNISQRAEYEMAITKEAHFAELAIATHIRKTWVIRKIVLLKTHAKLNFTY